MHAQPDNPTIVHLGERLAEAGAVLSIVLLTVCMSGEVYVWLSFRSTLSTKSQTVSLFLSLSGEDMADRTSDIKRQSDSQAFYTSQTGLFLLGSLQSRLRGHAVESTFGLDNCSGLHGFASRIYYSRSIPVGRAQTCFADRGFDDNKYRLCHDSNRLPG